MSLDILPTSLAKNVTHGSVMMDWSGPAGSYRVEAVVAYCAGCGKPLRRVPLDTTVAQCYICRKCYEKDPAALEGMVGTEEEFNRAVVEEMEARFGHALSDEQLVVEIEAGNLGKFLEALERESPYRKALPSGTRDH